MINKNDSVSFKPAVRSGITTPGLFLIMLVIFILPVIAILTEYYLYKTALDPLLIGKWFIFWGMGVQLFGSGIIRLINPGLVSMKRYNLINTKLFPVIRETGILNMAVGTLALLSLHFGAYRLSAALAGCIFFGIRTVSYFIRKPGNGTEMLLLLTDLIMFSILLLYLFFTAFSE